MADQNERSILPEYGIEAAMNKERLVVTYASVISETRIGRFGYEIVDTE